MELNSESLKPYLYPSVVVTVPKVLTPAIIGRLIGFLLLFRAFPSIRCKIDGASTVHFDLYRKKDSSLYTVYVDFSGDHASLLLAAVPLSTANTDYVTVFKIN